jgi:hypothetical protein
MENNAGKVVYFTNITDKDFEHAFGGQPFFVKAGETKMFPFDLADHLAKHLARRIFIEEDKSPRVFDPNDKSGGNGAPLWNDEKEAAMKAKILGEVYQEELAAPKSEIQVLVEKVDELNKFKESIEGKQAAPSEAPATPDVIPPPLTEYKDKAEVIDALKAKGIAFDARSSKATLEKLLTQK